jgi:hypothetical protein
MISKDLFLDSILEKVIFEFLLNFEKKKKFLFSSSLDPNSMQSPFI